MIPSAGLRAFLVSALICLPTFQVEADESVCRKAARTLGWGIGCGCVQHDLWAVQRTLHSMLPECSLDRSGEIGSRLADGLEELEDGLEESVNHDEHDLICAILCESMDWRSVDELIELNDDEASI